MENPQLIHFTQLRLAAFYIRATQQCISHHSQQLSDISLSVNKKKSSQALVWTENCLRKPKGQHGRLHRRLSFSNKQLLLEGSVVESYKKGFCLHKEVESTWECRAVLINMTMDYSHIHLNCLSSSSPSSKTPGRHHPSPNWTCMWSRSGRRALRAKEWSSPCWMMASSGTTPTFTLTM